LTQSAASTTNHELSANPHPVHHRPRLPPQTLIPTVPDLRSLILIFSKESEPVDEVCIPVEGRERVKRVTRARVVRRVMVVVDVEVLGKSSTLPVHLHFAKSDPHRRPARTAHRPDPLTLHKHEDGQSCTHDHASHKKKSRSSKLKPNAYEYDPMEKKRKKELKKAQKAARLEKDGQQGGSAVQGGGDAMVVEQGSSDAKVVEQGSSDAPPVEHGSAGEVPQAPRS
jgi:hypothetical protein